MDTVHLPGLRPMRPWVGYQWICKYSHEWEGHKNVQITFFSYELRKPKRCLKKIQAVGMDVHDCGEAPTGYPPACPLCQTARKVSRWTGSS